MKKPTENMRGLFRSTKGSLTKEQVAVGMHFCYCNACDLFEDAKLLLKNHKLARAFGLCVLCLEELAKIPLLSNGIFLQGKSDAAWAKFWNAFNSHTLKQNIWSVYGKQFLPKARRELYYKRSYPRTLPSLETLKQRSFYVDFTDGGSATRPRFLFRHRTGVVDGVFRMAEDRLKAFWPLHSKLENSIKMAKFASSIKFQGISDDEMEQMLFESIRAIKTYHQTGPHRNRG